jgi:hypothetical protein
MMSHDAQDFGSQRAFDDDRRWCRAEDTLGGVSGGGS